MTPAEQALPKILKATKKEDISQALKNDVLSCVNTYYGSKGSVDRSFISLHICEVLNVPRSKFLNAVAACLV